MTEAEWRACDDPYALIMAVENVSQRKGKLFVVGCCRQQESVFRNRLNRNAILAVEKNADGLITAEQLRSSAGRGRMGYRIATGCSSVPPVPMFVILATHHFHDKNEQAIQCHLIRDIFGNPFRHVAVDPAWPAWDDGAVRKMAQAIYDERAFDRLPLLADALEESGCTNADMLAHCRHTGPHVRGCCVVDVLLGKE